MNISTWENYWLSQSNINLNECPNLKKPLYVIMWHQLWWMLQCEKDNVVCHILTNTLMYVTMWHKLWRMWQFNINFDMWKCHNVMMSQFDINFDECQNVTFINVNFYECCNAKSTLMNVTMPQQLWWMAQCDKKLWFHHGLNNKTFHKRHLL